MPDDSEARLPIDNAEAMNFQSIHALRIAEQLGLPIVFRWPLDMANPDHVARHVAEFGPDSLPDDELGMYYVYYVISEDGQRTPVVKAEGEPRVCMFELALRVGGTDLADQFVYRMSLYARQGEFVERQNERRNAAS